MPTQAELESAFKVYFDEMSRCVAGNCYWALLHLVVILPDICGALQSSDGEAHKKHYLAWCERFLPSLASPKDLELSPEEWYEVRCILLHQGRTVAKRGRYSTYSFSQPGSTVRVHRCAMEKVDGTVDLTLDVGKMAEEMFEALRKWFAELQEPANNEAAQCVDRNLASLARLHREGNAIIQGLPIVQSFTTSSPRH